MKEQEYNKLVRDKIPEIIRLQTQKPIFHIASEHEYKQKIFEKLYEEINEFKNEPSEEELADIYEVLNSLCVVFNIDKLKANRILIKKKNKHGGFSNKIILEKVINEFQ